MKGYDGRGLMRFQKGEDILGRGEWVRNFGMGLEGEDGFEWPSRP